MTRATVQPAYARPVTAEQPSTRRLPVPSTRRTRRAPSGHRGRVAPGQRPRLGPLRRRVPGDARRVPRRHRVRVGPGGAHRGRRWACSATSPGATSSRSAPAPGSAPAGCAPRAAGRSASTSRMRQLQHSRRIDEDTGVAGALGARHRHRSCRSPTTSFDVVFCSFGALQFVADIADAVAETARVLRPGGRFAFSITHPTRWMFPDDPGEAGLLASQSYWDRTPYVEVDDETGAAGVRRAPPHPRATGWRCSPGTASSSTRPARARVAGGPRPGLGRLVRRPRPLTPGTAIFGARASRFPAEGRRRLT